MSSPRRLTIAPVTRPPWPAGYMTSALGHATGCTCAEATAAGVRWTNAARTAATTGALTLPLARRPFGTIILNLIASLHLQHFACLGIRRPARRGPRDHF